jgi:hypothetical protein
MPLGAIDDDLVMSEMMIDRHARDQVSNDGAPGVDGVTFETSSITCSRGAAEFR